MSSCASEAESTADVMQDVLWREERGHRRAARHGDIDAAVSSCSVSKLLQQFIHAWAPADKVDRLKASMMFYRAPCLLRHVLRCIFSLAISLMERDDQFLHGGHVHTDDICPSQHTLQSRSRGRDGRDCMSESALR